MMRVFHCGRPSLSRCPCKPSISRSRKSSRQLTERRAQLQADFGKHIDIVPKWAGARCIYRHLWVVKTRTNMKNGPIVIDYRLLRSEQSRCVIPCSTSVGTLDQTG